MKRISLIVITALTFACSGTKETTPKNINVSRGMPEICPVTGTCTFEILKDSALVYKINESTGRLYYETTKSPGKSILKYTYDKTRNVDLQDDFYTEEVIIETDNDITKLNGGKVKMVFGVFCYCKGTAGYYEVKEGTANYKDGRIIINTPNVVPNQLTTSIIAVIK